jgi:hypothetical protein
LKEKKVGNISQHISGDEAANYRWYFKNINYIMAAKFKVFSSELVWKA